MKESYAMTIVIHSTVGAGDGMDTFDMTLPARLDVTGGCYTLSYNEVRGSARVFTKLTYIPGGHRVTLKSAGGAKSDITFEVGVTHTSVYEVKPLCFDLTVRSQEVSATLDENGGEIYLSYTRDLGGDVTPVTYRLTATPREEEP